ncbi:MAG: TonB-dependent receptor [Candidatus Accumulibacter sp.]|nr:TonB-dependent receptor [Accumulibacter sp.]
MARKITFAFEEKTMGRIGASLYFIWAVVLSASAAEPRAQQEDATTGQAGLTQGSLSAYTLPTVTVYGVADQSPAAPVTTSFGTQFNVVTEEQIELQNSLDFYDALRNVPGVMFQKKNIIGGQTSSSLYIRGRGASHPSPDLNILFDDVPRSGVLYGQALADGIPIYALGGMEIYKYPQPSRFGSGYGMINFVPKYMAKEGTEFRIGMEGGSHGTIAENLSAGMKKGAFDIYAAQSIVRTDGHVTHSAGDQSSYYFNLGHQLAENWSVRLMANHVDASTEAPNNPLTKSKAYPRKFDTETSLVTLTLANEYEKAFGYIKGYYNDTNFYLRGESNGNATSKQSNDLYGLRARETLRFWEGNEIVVGFDFDKMDLENRQYNRATNVKRVWDFPDVTVFSPYVAVSQKFGSDAGFHIIPSAGLRHYHNSEFADKTAPQAGLVLGYSNTSLNLNFARGVNYPSPVVLQGFLENRSLPAGFDTGKIKPETVNHYEMGLTHTWKGLGSLSGTFFHDKGKNRTRAYMFGGAPDESFFNSSTARYRIRGVEISGNLTPVDNLDLFAGATWLRAKATGDDGEKQKKMPYTPRFAFQAGFKWKFLEHFLFSGDYQYLRDIYAATSARTSPTNNPGSNFPKLTKANKLPNVNVVNLRLDYLNIRNGKIFLAIDNAFDADYAYALETNGTTSANYYMPGRTFMAGFELKF